jgi:replicative DNA helicase
MLDEIVETIPTSAVFSTLQHREVWDQLLRQYNGGASVDPITIADAVPGTDDTDLVTMMREDSQIMSSKAASEMVMSKYMQRQASLISDGSAGTYRIRDGVERWAARCTVGLL